MTIDWRPYKSEIVDLHRSGNTLKAIQEVVAAKYNFKASDRSWRSQLKNWGCMAYQTGSVRPENLRPNRKGWKKRGAHEKRTSGSSQTSLVQRFEQPTEAEFPSSDIPTEESETLRVASQRLSRRKWGPEFAWMEQDIGDLISYDHPLHWALREGDDNAITQLIADGADPNLQAGGGLTPLHIAVCEGKSWSCIERLVRLGADVYQPDHRGNMPLHWAVRWNWKVLLLLGDKYRNPRGRGFDTVYENRDGFNYVHLALICYRLRLCTLSEVVNCSISFLEEHVSRVKLQLPTGEWSLDHMLETLSREHNFGRREDRVAFWDSIVSESSFVPGLSFLSTLTWSELESGSPRRILLPGSSVIFLDSLLTDLPICHLSEDDMLELAILGANLLVLDSRAEGFLIKMLIDTQASQAWEIRPGVILDMAQRYLPHTEYDHQDYIFAATYTKSNRSFLMKAIEDVELLPGHQKDHIAHAFVCGGNGFSKEADGRIPILEAAGQDLRSIVEHMLCEDQRSDARTGTMINDVQLSPYGRYHWPTWESSKQAEDWVQAVAMLEGGDLGELPNFFIDPLLRHAARKAILQKVEAQDRCVSWRATRDRARLAHFLWQCRKHDVEVDVRFYDKMVDMCVN